MSSPETFDILRTSLVFSLIERMNLTFIAALLQQLSILYSSDYLRSITW